MKQLEHLEQVAIMKWLELQHPIAFKHTFAIPNGGARSKITGAKLKKEGVKKGVPDLFLAYPSGKYYGLFIEYKAEKGKSKASKEQLEWIELLNKQGYCATVCRGIEAARALFNQYLSLEDRAPLLD